MESQTLPLASAASAIPLARSTLLYRAVLVALVAGSLALRLFAIGWGIPNFNPSRMAQSAYRNSYHIDEDNVIWGLMQMRPSQGNFDVLDYHWGTLQFFLVYGVLLGGEAVGILPSPWETAFQNGNIAAIPKIYELGRLVSVAAGVAGVLIVVALGTLAAGRLAGIAAGVAYALAPLAVVEAHYLTSDVSASVLAAAALLLAVIAAQNGRRRWLLWAGLVLGLAIGAKYSMAFAAPALLVAQSFAWRKRPANVRAGSVFGFLALPWLAVLAGFLIGEPYALVPGKLLEGIRTTVDGNAVDTSMGIGLVAHMLIWQLGNLGWFGLTLPIAILALVGLTLMGVQTIREWRANRPKARDPQPAAENPRLAAWTILLTATACFAASLLLNRVFMLRYTQPLVPLLSVAAGVGWAGIPSSAWRWCSGALAITVAGIVTVGQLSLMGGTHTANELLAWLDSNVKPGQTVARPWPEYPPIDGGSIKLIRLDPWQAALPAGSNPDYIVMDNMLLGPPQAGLTARIAADYRPVATFSAQPHIGPFSWDEGITPHDWKYSHPAFVVYARK
jgi:hypothetical protein